MVRRLSYLGLDFQIKLKVQTGDPQGLLVSYLSYTPNKTKVTVKKKTYFKILEHWIVTLGLSFFTFALSFVKKFKDI